MMKNRQDDEPVHHVGDGSDDQERAEAKRLRARRRFLTGGAAAGAVIATLGQKRAFAFSDQICASLGGTPNVGLTGKGFSDVKCGNIPA